MTDSSESLMEASRLPAAGTASEQASRAIVLLSDPQGARAEAIRALRTHILAQHVQEGRRALAICGASADVGCTFVSANLAVALSQIGLKTLLIDGNMRSPGVERLLPSPASEKGLYQYLTSVSDAPGDYIAFGPVPHLSIFYAGGTAPDAQELLAGEKFKALMDLCLRDFEATIVDTPPANTCADARRISNVVGYSLIVARRDKSFVDDVRMLKNQLHHDHARVVGTVLNEG